MIVYKQLMKYIANVKKEIFLKALLGIVITVTYVVQAIIMANIIEFIREGNSITSIICWILMVAGCILLRGVFIREFEAYAKVLASKVKGKIRIMVLEQMFLLGPGYLNARRSGKITSMIVDGIESLEAFFVSFVPQIITVLLTSAFIIGYLLQYDWVGALVLVVSVVLCIAVPLVTVPLINRTVTSYWSGYSVLTAQYIDTIQGMTTLKTLNAEKSRAEELQKDATDFYRKSIRNTGISLSNSSLMLILSAITSSVTVVIVAIRVSQGITAPAALTAFLFLAIECARPLADLDRYWHASFLGLSVARELCEFAQAVPEVQEKDQPDLSSLDTSHLAISFDHVSFSYSTGAQALQDVSLEIAPGSTVALAGRSGSGKSTILNLLLRFYDPSEGTICINGKDLKSFSLEYLQSRIAVVFQDSFLFYGTIMDNIKMARPDADESEVIEAAKAANAHDFITLLPDGYQTKIGERGLTLSGGERQRISIARAILKNAPIVLLDEATSSVDAHSEKLIQEALKHLLQGKTTIIVAHRLSTIQNADKIYVMDAGRIVESGRHEELLRKNGIYRNLVEAQEVMADGKKY